MEKVAIMSKIKAAKDNGFRGVIQTLKPSNLSGNKEEPDLISTME